MDISSLSSSSCWECFICRADLSAAEAAQFIAQNPSGIIETSDPDGPHLPIMSLNCQHSMCCQCIATMIHFNRGNDNMDEEQKKKKPHLKNLNCDGCKQPNAFRCDRMNVNMAVLSLLARQVQEGRCCSSSDVAATPPSECKPAACEGRPCPTQNGENPSSEEGNGLDRQPAAKEAASTLMGNLTAFLSSLASRAHENASSVGVSDPQHGEELGTCALTAIPLDDSSADEMDQEKQHAAPTSSHLPVDTEMTDKNLFVWKCENCRGILTPREAVDVKKTIKEGIKRKGKKQQVQWMERPLIEFNHDFVPIMSVRCAHSVCSNCILNLDKKGKQTQPSLVNLKCPICGASEAFRADRMNMNEAVVELLMKGYTAPDSTTASHSTTHGPSESAEIPPLQATEKLKKPPSCRTTPQQSTTVGAIRRPPTRKPGREAASLPDSLTVFPRGPRQEKLRAQDRIGKLEKALEKNDDALDEPAESPPSVQQGRVLPTSGTASQLLPVQRLGQGHGVAASQPLLSFQHCRERAQPVSASQPPEKRLRRSSESDRDTTDEVIAKPREHRERRVVTSAGRAVAVSRKRALSGNVYAPSRSVTAATAKPPQRAPTRSANQHPATGPARPKMSAPAGDCRTAPVAVPHRRLWRPLDHEFVDEGFPKYSATVSLPPPFPTIRLVQADSSGGSNAKSQLETEKRHGS